MNIRLDGCNVSYKFTGEGEKTAVVLQGWGTTMEIYDSVAAALPEGWRLLQFDLPGFGSSEEPREAWNVDRYADFFCHFMEALQIREAALIGHSYGGRIILKLCGRDHLPFTISKLVLMDSAGIMPKRSWKQRLKIKRYKFLKKFLNMKLIYFLFPEVIDDWRSRQGSEDYRNATPIMRQAMVMAVNEDLSHLLPSVKSETLLIWGDKDTATPLSDGQKMEKEIAGSGLVVFEGAGHYAFLEQPALFQRVMRAFLG